MDWAMHFALLIGTKKAESAFETSIKKDPQYWDAYNNLGLVRIQMNDVEGAITVWEILLKQNSSYCKAHIIWDCWQYGSMARRSSKFTSTLTYCPNNIIAHYGLGTIYYEAVPNKKRAIFHYEKLLYIKPNFEKNRKKFENVCSNSHSLVSDQYIFF